MATPRDHTFSNAEDSAWSDVTGVYDRPIVDEDFEDDDIDVESSWEGPAFKAEVPGLEFPASRRPSGRVLAPHRDGAGDPAIVASYTRLVADYAIERGLDVTPIAQRFGIDGLLDNGDARVPFEAFRGWTDAVSEALGEPDLGLNAGRRVRPGHFGTLGFALSSCVTARQFIDRTVRYSALVHDGCRNEIEVRGGSVVWRFITDLPRRESLGRVHGDLNTTMWITLARWIFDATQVMPTFATFEHERPEYAHRYSRIFGPDVRFGADCTSFAFPEAARDRPLASAHGSVSQVLDALCERQLESLLASRNAPWLRQCSEIIASTFDNCEPRIDVIAERMSVSVRELRRRLADHHTEYRAVVNQVRFEVARRQLLDPSIGIAEIAYTLGFSQQSAFQRAFKRWTGVTPGEFRRRRGA